MLQCIGRKTHRVNDNDCGECKIIEVIRPLPHKIMLFSLFLPLIAGAQPAPAPSGAVPIAKPAAAPAALCEKIFREPRYPMTAVTPTGFYRNKATIPCGAPVARGEGFVTGCSDGSVKFVGKNGVETGSIALDVDEDDGRPGDVAVVSIPGTNPQRFFGTIPERENAFLFDENLKIQKTFFCDSDLTKPLLFSSGTVLYACIGGMTAQFVPRAGAIPLALKLPPNFSNVEYSPLLFTASDKKEYAVFVNMDGQVILYSEKGEVKVIPLSESSLSKPVFAADGRLVTVDASGVVHFLNLENAQKTSFPLVLTSVLSGNKNLRIDAPVLFKDQKIAFLGGGRIYYYNLATLRPYVIFDAALSRRAWYNDGTKDKYVSDPSKNADLTRVELADGTELIWAASRGGVLLLNSIGRVVGVFRFSDAKDDNLSAPVKQADGSYLFGSHFGMERLNIAPKTVPDMIPSGSLAPCN